MKLIEICYQDADILVCVKPSRVLSTDEPGGLPELLRIQLGDPGADIRTVHRLDRVVSGLMVLACSPQAASELSRQVREGLFQKTYWAVLHGVPDQNADTLEDLGAQIGFDQDVWAGTVESYLACVEQGEDTLFHKRPEMLYPLSEGPFYAVRICCAMDGTLNGIRVNQYMQALDADLKAIDGLFMGGYDAGGFWGNLYYQTEHTNALTQGYSLSSGYIAANKVIELLGA